MSDTRLPHNGIDNGDDERELRDCLRADLLTPAALTRIRHATEVEWRRNLAPRRPRMLAIAASVVLLAGTAVAAFLHFNPPPSTGALMAHLTRADSPGVVAVLRWQPDAPWAPGAEMRAGQTFEARGVALVSLQGGGNLRLRPGAVFRIEGANTVWLERGEIYVDIPPGSHPAAAFVARTADGEFRHVGTQFALAVVDGATRLRVREGAVQWRTNDGESTVAAGTEMIFDNDRKAAPRPIDSADAEWAWTETVAPDIDIENRPLSEFLTWVARETGRKLVFADDEARRQIGAIRMHGNIRGLSTLQALSAVMAATTLRFDLAGGAIRVSLAGASPQPISR